MGGDQFLPFTTTMVLPLFLLISTLAAFTSQYSQRNDEINTVTVLISITWTPSQVMFLKQSFIFNLSKTIIPFPGQKLLMNALSYFMVPEAGFD